MAPERAAGQLPAGAQDDPESGSLVARVGALATRQPGPRPWLVFVVSVAIESACMVAIGAVDQTRHVLGLPGSVMALMAVIAGALGGPVVGLIAALTGGAVYTTTVASFGTRGEWPTDHRLHRALVGRRPGLRHPRRCAAASDEPPGRGLALRPQPDRSQPRPAGDHQSRGQDHRRQRGHRAGHRRAARAARRHRLLATTSPSRRRREPATSRSSPRASCATIR